MADDHTERLEVLAEGVREAVAAYADLASASGVQMEALAVRANANRKQIRRTRRMFWALAVSVALDIVLSALVYFLVMQVQRNENAVAAVAHRLDIAQTTTRQGTLCPFYVVLLGAKNDKARAVFPQGPAAYDHVFAVIRDGYKALDCAATVKQ